MLVPLKEKTAFGVRNAFAKAFKRIPREFKKTLTYDRGSEMSEHKLFTKKTEIQILQIHILPSKEEQMKILMDLFANTFKKEPTLKK
jgi:hypothetical protein